MAIQDSLQDRKAKGYKIAQQKQIWITKDGWLVESQSGNGFYKVSNAFICNCPDSELHKETCKHAFAVRYYLNIEKKGINGLETEKIPLTYQQAWSIYNQAQTSEGKLFYDLLRDLVKDIQDLNKLIELSTILWKIQPVQNAAGRQKEEEVLQENGL